MSAKKVESVYKSTHLIDYIPEFMDDVELQLIDDEKRYGETWIERGRPGQERRFVEWCMGKYREWVQQGDTSADFPWLKVAGEALIGYVRQKYSLK